ncbi:MAG: high-affinity nickel-transport family protein, partial [Candidatus Rokubacteria bacterium]|nr:high-affinity nickel-transport family protein [Candidatus Rokubacteria bacterium]
MDSVLWVIGLGLLLGIQHATDPDHVLAVATIVSREPRFSSGVLIGALWGLGHTVTLATAGGAIILLNLTVPPVVARALELAVALMLVGLGAVRLFATFRGMSHIPPEHLRARHAHG